jgi:serine/threonine-protein kinase
MTPGRGERIYAAFEAALGCDPADRAALLDGLCSGAPEMRAEVERLLAEDAQASREHFLTLPFGLGQLERVDEAGGRPGPGDEDCATRRDWSAGVPGFASVRGERPRSVTTERAGAARDLLTRTDSAMSAGKDDLITNPVGVSTAAARDDTEFKGKSFPGEQLKVDFLTPSERPGLLGYFGSYEVIEIAGQGGMGIVLKAFDPALHRFVAIKVLSPTLSPGEAARRRFAREAKAAAAICHEHVVAIHAVDTLDNLPYLVMQFIFGESLQERLNRTGPLKLNEIVRIGMEIAAGLAAAHAQDLIHRDIKPSNILLEDGVERVKITDFGLARAVDDSGLTQSGILAGTPQYMAPEQARGERLDHRADLFSLGSVLYAMCTGRSPFRANGTMAVLRRVCEDTPHPIREINPDIPEWLVEIIAKLHAKGPADRFQSAADVAGLLRRHLAHLREPLLVPIPRGSSGDDASRVEYNPIALACNLGIAAISILAWIGWATNWRTLAATRPMYIPMAPNTALCFFLLAAALWLRSLKRGVTRRGRVDVPEACAAIVILIGLARVCEFVTHLNLSVDRWFFQLLGGMLGLAPVGNMALFTAIFLLVGGLTLALLICGSHVRRVRDMGGTLGLLVIAAGSIFLLGYLFDAPLLYGGRVIPMALNSALAFVLLGTGIVAETGPAAFPMRLISGPSVRVRLMRTFLPFITGIVIFVAWLTHMVTINVGDYHPALVSAGSAVLSVLLVGAICDQISRQIGERIERAEEALRKAHDELEDRVVERTRELVQTKALLERRNRDLQQLAGEINRAASSGSGLPGPPSSG